MLKMEILDAAGNTVYLAPVDLVGEEVAPFLPYRFVTVEIYRPPVNVEGLGKLTILGEIEILLKATCVSVCLYAKTAESVLSRAGIARFRQLSAERCAMIAHFALENRVSTGSF